jgi:hypothetical protein
LRLEQILIQIQTSTLKIGSRRNKNYGKEAFLKLVFSKIALQWAKLYILSICPYLKNASAIYSFGGGTNV